MLRNSSCNPTAYTTGALILGSEVSWVADSTFCSAVMLRKEATEREREQEQDSNSLPARSGRRGQRRKAYLANLPP